MAKETEVLEAGASGNGSERSSVADVPQSGDAQPARPKEAAETRAVSKKAPGRATGPRSPAGKQRSSQNALKHGIFSKHAFPPNVQWNKLPAPYRKLHRSLVSSLRPETPMEEILVEVIASTFYRWRAVAYLQTCLLAELQFDVPSDVSIPQEVRDQIIGEFMSSLSSKARIGLLEGLPDRPELQLPPNVQSEAQPAGIQHSEIEIDPALRLREENRRLELLGETMDRLQKYEAHFWRIHVRAVSELERWQRRRLGDAVPAPVVVDVQN